MSSHFRDIPGGVCAPIGFEAAGVACGLKSAAAPGEGKDLALLRSLFPAACAGVFTTNVVKAAPVLLCQQRVSSGQARAVVINSGNANCLTAKQGYEDALAMAELAAHLLGVKPEQVMVCSTGIIGRRLPMAKIRRGIRKAVRSLSRRGATDAALAIMTTDTRPKQTAVEFQLLGRRVRIGGMAKGAGMISPSMATMLAFITTDAALPARTLQACLNSAVKESFNRISVDGDMSPSDTVLLLTNGAAKVSPRGAGLRLFQEGLNLVAGRLARMLVEDGEGATKVICITVEGAASNEKAGRIARAIANSMLVKCALHGADPNWGRILTAAGAAGIKFDVKRADLFLADIAVFRQGEPVAFPAGKARRALSSPEVEIRLDLHSGPGCATILTCDLSEEYVRFNAEYTT